MKLVIVESPNKTKKIAEFLGASFRVEASFGHVRDLPATGDVGIEKPGYQLQYEVPESKAQQVKRLTAAARQADEVYLGTDPDREGEAIAWHLKEVLNLRNPKRVKFNVIDAPTIRAAIASPGEIDMHLVRAQEARRALDRLVGWTVSPVLKQLVSSTFRGEQTSAGRVQTPAVLLCALREAEIQSFKTVKHFSARAYFDDASWYADLIVGPLLPAGQKLLLDQTIAATAAQARNFTVVESETKPVASSPPPPFITSTLLQAASTSLDMPTERTQKVAQALFELGLITYHRTDNPNLSDEAIAAVRDFAASRGWALAPQQRSWKAKEGAQEAHEAIRPAKIDLETAGADDDQRRLYRLIWQRAIACQLASAEYEETVVTLEVEGSPQFRFRGSGRVLRVAGWTVVTARDATDEQEDDEGSPGRVPPLPRGTRTKSDRTELLAKDTKPAKRYTEATLIDALEKHGIGRPATYAAILATIKHRGYVRRDKKALICTPFGQEIIRVLRGRFGFVELDFTKGAEERLDAIAEGRAAYLTVLEELDGQLMREIAATGIDPDAMLAPSEKALAFAQRLATALSVELPPAAMLSAGSLSRWINDNKGNAPPSEKAVEFARSLAEELAEEIPKAVLASAEELRKWLDKAKGRAAAARRARAAEVPASQAQIDALQKLIESGRIEAPESWPNISKADASMLFDNASGGPKGRSSKAGKAPARKRTAKRGK